MENRAKLLFEGNQSSQWYLALGERCQGPLSAQDVYDKVLNHEISWVNYIWKPGLSDWKRICDVKIFDAVLPPEPSQSLQAKVRQIAQEKASPLLKRLLPPPFSQKKTFVKERIWFLYYHDSQFGPFSTEEVLRFIQVGKISPEVNAWRDGMEGWEMLTKIREFEPAVSAWKKNGRPRSSSFERTGSHERTGSRRIEKRKSFRRPLVARIFLSHEDAVIVAVCRDISVGGMQVLTDRIPGGPGTRLKMNVSPAGDVKSAKLQPFLAEGIVVRVLEDQCGFSFRFENLPDRAKRAIEGYIASAT